MKYTSIYAWIALVALCSAFGLLAPSFLSAENLGNILLQTTPIAFVAIGITLVILSGSIDLSVGSVVGLTGVLFGVLCHAGIPYELAILLSLSFGAFVGILNGALVAYGKIPSFVATLGMMGIARGVALWITEGRSISDLPSEWVNLIDATTYNLPLIGVLVIIVFLVCQLLLKKTVGGRRLVAVGSNPKAAWLCGIKTKAYRVFVFAAGGLFAALGGLVLTGRLSSAHPLSGSFYEIDAIAAVVIGGGTLAGGRATFVGTLAGILVLGVLRNGLSLMNVGSYAQQVMVGVIVIVAVALDSHRRKGANIVVQ